MGNQLNVRLSDECLKILSRLQVKTGHNQRQVIEEALYQMADDTSFTVKLILTDSEYQQLIDIQSALNEEYFKQHPGAETGYSLDYVLWYKVLNLPTYEDITEIINSCHLLYCKDSITD